MLHVSYYIFKLERNKSSIKPKIKESRQPYRVGVAQINDIMLNKS
jgi:hypothetical protein